VCLGGQAGSKLPANGAYRLVQDHRKNQNPRPPEPPRIDRMFEDGAARLLQALCATFGETPDWELRRNNDFGFYLYYDGEQADMAEVRRVIVRTLGFGVGVILAPRATDQLLAQQPGGPREQVSHDVRSRVLALTRATPPAETGG
jgi:hypothetical protein